MNKYEYHGIVNGKRLIFANSISQLKRLASVYANNTFNPIDTLDVALHNVYACENVELYHFERFNKVLPKNTIERGTWK